MTCDFRCGLRTALSPEEHEAAIQEVIRAGKAVGTPTGIHEMTLKEP